MGYGMREQTGLSRKNWRDVWRMIIKRAPKQQKMRQACMLEDLEPRTLMSAVTATPLSPTSVELNWTDTSSESGYYVLRSTDGTHFSQIATASGSAARSYTDSTVSADHTYEYKIEGYTKTLTATSTAAPSNVASVTTPMIAPTGLTATVKSATSIQLNWASTDTTTIGYYILCSTNGGSYSQIAQVTSARTKTVTLNSLSSDTTYSFRVEAYKSGAVSAVSNTVSAATPLIAPSAAAATALSNTSVRITWTDNDSHAAGYYVLRATDGVHFTKIATLGSGADSYTDSTVSSAHAYQYEIQAYSGTVLSAVTGQIAVSTPLAAPTALAATVNPTSVLLSWTNNDANTVGYLILRSTDGVHYTQIAKITSINTKTFTDTTVLSGTQYDYIVEAYNGSIVAASAVKALTTPLVAPINPAAVVQNGGVKLTWTDEDTHSTGYDILRSTNNSTWTQIATVNGASANSFVDTTATGGETYYYRVQAFNAVATSAATASAAVNMPSDGVTITVRYGDELVITEAAGGDDTVDLFQSGSVLTVDADGTDYTEADPAAGVFIYARGQADAIDITSSVTVETTVVSIGAGPTQITSAGSDVGIWCDSTDAVTGTGVVHKIANFAGGVSKALGAALANPTDSGSTMTVLASLWGTGPVAADVNQGEVGDCYFLSSLAAFAGLKPQQLEQSAVDLGDGTYAVEFYSNGTPTFIRVNDQFPTGPFNGYLYAHPGADGDIWAPVLEKAFAYFRTGANTYDSINSGWMSEVYSDLGVPSMNFTPASYSSSALYTMLSTDLNDNDPVTLGTNGNAPNLVSDHAYTLVSAYELNGVTYYVVRNPWGVSGDSLENSSGYATLTYSQVVSNFDGGTAAT